MARVVIPGFRKIEVSGGGEGGTTNYNDLTNKPSINNVPLVGNLKTVDLKLTDSTLTKEGVPAEAKTVGQKLEEQSASLTALSEQLGNHTVKSDVPENAVFTDTVYDDTEVKEDVDTLKKETTVNLLKPTLGTVTQNGVTCTNNGDGTYTFNGTNSSSTKLTFFVGNATITNKDRYKLVGCPTNKSTGNHIHIYLHNDDYSIVLNDYGKGKGNDTILPSGVYYIRIEVIENETVNDIFKPMITTNLDATYDDFVSYTGDTGQINSDVASLLKRIETLESLVNKTDTTAVETE